MLPERPNHSAHDFIILLCDSSQRLNATPVSFDAVINLLAYRWIRLIRRVIGNRQMRTVPKLLGLIAVGLALSSPLLAQPNAPIPVVLSTDVGNEIDDQWAIMYLLFNS